ncbi:MAG: DUF349 domain-containing protein [Erysipelotrichia bacterium]|nr:DUF349 domain-containing protein [Erysipelotrichia bacterium]
MYNDDEMYEVSDYDEDIQSRQELIEEAKKLQEENDGVVDMRVVSDLNRRWKRITYWESAFEDQLAETFDHYIDAFYSKRNEGYKANKEAKEKLVEQAKQLSKSNDFNHDTKAVNALMDAWKAIGSAGKDFDDALWNVFNEARQTFFDRKREHYKQLKEKFAHAKEVKQQLIEQAAKLCDDEDLQKTSEAFKSLMDEWKAVGSAGREFEDALWDAFNEHRQKFYTRRNEYYDALHEQHAQKYAAKKQLVEQARAIADSGEYTRNHTEKMKALTNEWKTIGNCGKDKEDKIWQVFRKCMDDFFEGLRNFNDQKHESWKQKMIDARTRKLDQIQNQKRQITRIQNDIVGLLGERAINEAMASIEDKKVFIEELEAEVADIDKTLENEGK